MKDFAGHLAAAKYLADSSNSQNGPKMRSIWQLYNSKYRTHFHKNRVPKNTHFSHKIFNGGAQSFSFWIQY